MSQPPERGEPRDVEAGEWPPAPVATTAARSAANGIWRVVGGLLILQALWVIAAWHSGAVRLAQFGTSANPVRYNTAVCLALIGTAMLAGASRRRWLAVAASGASTLIAGLTTFEYVLHVDLRIDDALGLAVEIGETPRMAPNTAVCLALLGGSLMLSLRRPTQGVRLGAQLCATVAASVGLAAVVGHAFDAVRLAASWSALTAMAPATATAIVVSACSIVFALLKEETSHGSKAPWLPFTAALGVVVGSVLLYQALKANEDLTTRSWVRVFTSDVAADVRQRIVRQGDLLHALAARRQRDTSHESWLKEVEWFRETHAAFVTIQDFGPGREPGDPVGLSAGNRLAHPGSSSRTESVGYSRSVEFDGRRVVMVTIRLEHGGRLAGFVVGAVDLAALLTPVADEQSERGRGIVISEGAATLVSRRNAATEGWAESAAVDVSDLHLQVRLTPALDGPIMRARDAYAPGLIILAGVVLAVLAAAAVSLSQVAHRKTAELLLDIARREQLERRLQAAHDALSRAQRIAHVGSWDWNLDTNDLAWSDETWRIFGLAPSAFRPTYHEYLQRVHADDRAAVEQAVGVSLNEKKPFMLLHRIVRPDGTLRVVRSGAEIDHDAAGLPATMHGVVLDVTEQQTAADAVARSERLLQLVLQTLPLGVYIADADGLLRTANRVAHEIWQGSPMVGIAQYGQYRGWWAGTGQLVAAEDWTLARTIRTGQPCLDDVVDIECFDGSRKTITSSSVPILDPTGTNLGAVVVIEDITERQRTAALLAKHTQNVERSNADLEQFAYVASHDLQEPLRTILSYTQLLSRRYGSQLDDSAREFMEFTVDAARRMKQLIGDLLDYSRVGTQAESMSPIAAGEVVLDALRNLQEAIAESDAKIDVAALPHVCADRGQLLQVFQNLIGNAIKFRAGVPPSVSISSRTDGRFVRFAVSDNGIGIDPAHAERIFAVFQRLHGIGHYSGTGIGLAISKKIVERHGGRIWVESSPGQGATFFFTVPRMEATAGHQPKVDHAA